jgi:heme-degrading monooxygenase HmoA
VLSGGKAAAAAGIRHEAVPRSAARGEPGGIVIARIWHGITLHAVADEYLKFLRERAISDYRATPGNLAAYVLHRKEGRLAHFLTVTHWESLQSIEAFAGSDITRAKYYPEDAGFLLEYEPTVQHYTIDAVP